MSNPLASFEQWASETIDDAGIILQGVSATLTCKPLSAFYCQGIGNPGLSRGPATTYYGQARPATNSSGLSVNASFEAIGREFWFHALLTETGSEIGLNVLRLDDYYHPECTVRSSSLTNPEGTSSANGAALELSFNVWYPKPFETELIVFPDVYATLQLHKVVFYPSNPIDAPRV